MKDRSNDPLHYERILLPRSYLSLPNKNKVYIRSPKFIQHTLIILCNTKKKMFQQNIIFVAVYH